MDEGPSDPNLLLQLFPRIARELAMQQYPLDEVLRRYDLTREYYDETIETNPYFKALLTDYIKEWQSIRSTPQRLAFGAATALEENLPVLASRMGDRRSALGDAVSTAKLFRDLAGIAPPAPSANVGTGEKFTINISFGGHKVALETVKQVDVIEEKALEAPKPDAG